MSIKFKVYSIGGAYLGIVKAESYIGADIAATAKFGRVGNIERADMKTKVYAKAIVR